METTALLLAAGEGKRMKSRRPKVLHRICGRSLLQHVLAAAEGVSRRQVIVVGHGRDRVMKETGPAYHYIVQEEQLGTGHAVKMAWDYLDSPEILVLCGDTPLLCSEHLKSLLHHHRSKGSLATVLTALLPNPKGYGRIVLGGGGRVEKIVEDKDTGPEEGEIREVNTGTYCFNGPALRNVIHRLSTDNAQGEYYLTDVMEILAREGKTAAWQLADYRLALGVNTREELAEAARCMREAINREHMLSGVTLVDPLTSYVDAGVLIGEDTILYPNTLVLGSSRIGRNCHLGPNARIQDSILEDGALVAESVVIESRVRRGEHIGPYVSIKPDRGEEKLV